MALEIPTRLFLRWRHLHGRPEPKLRGCSWALEGGGWSWGWGRGSICYSDGVAPPKAEIPSFVDPRQTLA
jgi:hypothetical protein